MKALFQTILACFAGESKDELAHQIAYLKIENEILRGKLPERIDLTAQERNRLLKYGKLVGSALAQLITIVTFGTFQRWLNAEKEAKPKVQKKAEPGRPKTDEEVREVILRLARETEWGYLRIHGELKKLGVKVSRMTVVKILREAGIDPNPERKKGTWHQFIKSHAATLWACDFFTQKVWTLGGLVDYHVLFFIHIESRRVIITGMTPNPDGAWVLQQARNFVLLTEKEAQAPKYLIHDLDTKFTQAFDARLADEGVEAVKVGPRAPNLNAHCERWVLSLRSECLDHFMVFGESHLQYIINSYVEYYNKCRPHQGVGNVPLQAGESEPVAEGEIVCHEWLGGTLKHYERKAA